MPFSRHWIMHIEAMCRIKNRLCRKARKGADRGEPFRVRAHQMMMNESG